jgi:exocyst complex component 4
MQNELLSIVTKSTQHIIAVNQQPQEENSPESIPILQLLDLLFKQFKLIANVHQMTLNNYANVIKRHQIPVKPYDLVDFWNQCQAVLQLVLTDYLDIQNDGGDEMLRNQFPEQTMNINSFFSRRKQQM